MGQVHAVVQRRWFRRGVVALLAFDLLVAGGALGLHARDRAEPFSADDALAEFRAATATTVASSAAAPASTTPVAAGVPTTEAGSDVSGPSHQERAIEESADPAAASPTDTPGEPEPPEPALPASPPFPAEGVYLYDTTGFEEVDALGGARHDYPAQTSIVHRREGCGATETWQPFEDRKDVRQLCAAPGRHHLARFDSTRSFFGQTDTRRLECDEGATAFAADARPGEVFEFRCAEGGVEAANRLEILGVEQVVVGGQPVEAVRSRATSQVTGGSSGSSTVESWVHPETGLTLKRISVLDGSEPGPGGSVSYHEEYTLVLRALEPRR